MTIILAQLSPQRSTQYSDLVADLAPYEIALTSIGSYLTENPEFVRLGSQDYLKLSLKADLDDDLLQELPALVMSNAYFEYYEQIGDMPGPFLKPLEIESETFLPESLIATRRYRGKTNELFTQFMCNIARANSAFADTPWHKLTLLDPLSGGGTTLFVGLTLGADVVGVEQDKKVVDGTIAFLKQYMKEARISAKFREDKFKNIGKRWFITVKNSARCVVGRGDTVNVKDFVHGLKRPQLLVTDLPYGIQHRAEWLKMLRNALPLWFDTLVDGGTMVFSWNASDYARDEMVALVEDVSDFKVLNDAPYNQLSHRVDRVIKNRDIIIARK